MRNFIALVSLVAVALVAAIVLGAPRTVTTLLAIPLGGMLGFAGAYRAASALMTPPQRRRRPARTRVPTPAIRVVEIRSTHREQLRIAA